jgi:hypothetical protein
MPFTTRELFPNMFVKEQECEFVKQRMPALVPFLEISRLQPVFSKINSDDLEKMQYFKTYDFRRVSSDNYVSVLYSLLDIFQPAFKDEFLKRVGKTNFTKNDKRSYLNELSALINTDLYVWSYDIQFELLFPYKILGSKSHGQPSTVFPNVPLCLFECVSNSIVDNNVTDNDVIPLIPITYFSHKTILF